MGRILRVTLIVAALLIGSLGPATGRAVAAACVIFPETGTPLCDRFLDYWVAHGGLAINGYPLTEARMETLEDGQQYLVQWFERVRMEYHPESADPQYQILLGQFGRRIHPADPRVSPNAAMRYFPATGHNLAPDLAVYWDTNGGLAQFGYPLTEELTETLGGQPYTVQYTERARFERHPENSGSYTILLGQFGRQLLTAGPSPSAAPSPPPSPPPSPSPAPSPAPPATNIQVTATVSDGSPTRNERVTVTAIITANGQGVAGATMDATWHYKTTTSYCSGGPSGADGRVSCTRDISAATKGYFVAVDVMVHYQGQNYVATTGFTPR